MLDSTTIKKAKTVLRASAEAGAFSSDQAAVLVDALESAAVAQKDGNLGCDRLLSTKEAANILGCCPRTVRRLGAKGSLTPVRITGSARSLRWRMTEINRITANFEDQ